ncbi:MAG: dephospho-CoA kinase [Spirochaetaceae bacterium]|jgi:dephospho-CoA kinase|nr:dephospho-CoA kinase [Spirochaetaceae bacterium]
MENGGTKKVIGLAGLMCAGKNYAASLLEKRGIPVLDVDRLGHEALRTEKAAVAARFGDGVLDGAGEVDRKKLASVVFGKPEELAALEAIVHPAVNRLTTAWIERQAASCVINAALLHRSAAFTRLDAIILVEAWLPVRLFRARKRDRLPWSVILKRFHAQRRFIAQYLSRETDIYSVYNNPLGPGVDAQLEGIISRLGLWEMVQ